METVPAPAGLARLGVPAEPYGSAEEVRRHNAALDAAIRRAADLVPERHLHDEMSDEPRTLAVQLGHLGELSRFAARQLGGWLDGRRMVLGRVAEADADLADALERATLLRLATLRQELDAAAAELAAVLQQLADEHLGATVTDVVIGREPLTGFLQRHVLGHKATHLEQLRATLRSADIVTAAELGPSAVTPPRGAPPSRNGDQP